MPSHQPIRFSNHLFIDLVAWVLVWAVLGTAIYLSVGHEQPIVLQLMAALALVSLFLLLRSLIGHWHGRIVDIRIERVKVDDAESFHWENLPVAYILEPDGHTRRTLAQSNWQIGDLLEKRLGETDIHKIA